MRPAIEREAQEKLGAAEADAFLTRLDQLSFDILEPLTEVYGADAETLAADLVRDALNKAAERPPTQRLLDRRREIDPAWFQRSDGPPISSPRSSRTGSSASSTGRT